MIFGVELEHGADVDGADDVDVVEEEGLVEILWIFEEETGGFFQAAADFEESAAGEFDEGFGAIVRERAEARAEAGAKDHGFHGSARRKDPEASERFLSAQADRLAGASRKEKASACSVRNDRR